jgi:hypothetical protein
VNTKPSFVKVSFTKAIGVTLACLIGMTVSGATKVIGFDDLQPGSEWLLIGSGYEGFQWTYFAVYDGSRRPAGEGYRNGMISSNNVAFNLSGEPAALACGTAFDLNSAYLTAHVPSVQQLRVQGLIGTNVTYDNTYALNVDSPTLVNFDYLGIDSVKFLPQAGNWFVLENLTVTRSNSPPPPVHFQKALVSTIGHTFRLLTGLPLQQPGRVYDYLVDQGHTSGGGAELQPAYANFDTNHQFALTLSAPPGKRFKVHSPGGEPVKFFGGIEWNSGGNPGPGEIGSVTVAFGGLQGTPPDFSVSSSFLSGNHGSFGFYSIGSTELTNDLSFSSVTFTAAFSSPYTNSGTLRYPISGNPTIGLSFQTPLTNDPGSFVSLVDEPKLTIRLQPNGDVIVAFTGTLQSADSVNGTFQDIPGNPQGIFTIPRSNLMGSRYFRAR